MKRTELEKVLKELSEGYETLYFSTKEKQVLLIGTSLTVDEVLVYVMQNKGYKHLKRKFKLSTKQINQCLSFAGDLITWGQDG